MNLWRSLTRPMRRKKDIDERLADTGSSEGARAKLLAVTSCPTGIAHTYMAAEGLEKAAKAKDCFIKIETRGSGGAKNVLTDQEIREADCIIVAADAKVPMDRFDGKKVIECQVSDGISKADQLVERAISGDVPVYHAAAGSQSSSSNAKAGGGAGHQDLYAADERCISYASTGCRRWYSDRNCIPDRWIKCRFELPFRRPESKLRYHYSGSGYVKKIGGTAFGFMLPILAGFIAMAIGDRPALALGFVGGMMAANGKSGFLGALVAGFAAGYIILGLRKVM